VELRVIPIDKPQDVNLILGQAHFIKTVEDLHEALAQTSPVLRFGVAFCESSGPRLIRRTGNDAELVHLAVAAAKVVGAGHCFVVLLREGFPISVLNSVKLVPEVCRVYCATANPVEVVVAETDRGRAIVGVVDGDTPLGVETDQDVQERDPSCAASATNCECDEGGAFPVRALGSGWSQSPKEALVVRLHAGLDLRRARLEVCLLDAEGRREVMAVPPDATGWVVYGTGWAALAGPCGPRPSR
jgi:uncharacterized protein